PPRSGTLTEIKKAMLYASPSKIIYVSCNPVSLAWDLKQLCVGGYRVTAIQPFDMFPHTHHVETVCLLTRIFCT
ncbi:MAG: 23S rRNA (uracil-5-)-methyltransferase RumA, partial [Bacteroidales bacterium]|nr:23S rRNA (uracil-5-)-methyltransferase RumA [Bacteroidales bacterium]